jgi:DNA-binding NarL/FixJ family response regulator
MATSVLIVEDNPSMLATFAEAVRGTHDLWLAGMASDLPEGLRLLKATEPDVLLVDIGLPSGSGIDLIRFARENVPRCEVMVITVFADDQAILACIEAGATGYLLKDARDFDIAHEIRLLCSGGSPISPSIARRLVMRLGGAREGSTTNADAETAQLSDQELSVLTFSAKGYNFEEIARLMGLSRHTVETYVKRIYRKLQVHSKTEAVYEARKLGLMRD